MRPLLTLVITLSLSTITPLSSTAQCAMCKATVESNTDQNTDGQKVAKKLNNGILYMMTAPYIVLASIGYLFWKHRKKVDE